MEMEREIQMKKMRSEPGDRLSELPDSLIFNIFEFLPMKNVVRTQILSHHWENLWTITPNLYFDNETGDFDKFRNLVNRCLICWRGKRIQKFKIRSHTLDKSLFSDIDMWVRFAVDNGVQELDISFNRLDYDPYKEEYCVPKCLYSCCSLQKLSFFGSITEINGNGVQWNQLKSLNIKCRRITQHAIDLVLSGIPVLEDFKLGFITYKDDKLSLSFRSTSLKRLIVSKKCKDIQFPDNTELRIWTPNLEILSIYGDTYSRCLLMNVSSLTHATLAFGGIALSEVIGASLLSPLPSVVFLDLNGHFKHEQIVGLLENFPKLKTLVIRAGSKCDDPKSKKNFKPNPSKSFLVELRTIEVTWYMRDFLIFPLIEMLLKYASKLEKMVFQVKPLAPISASSISLLLESQTKLLRMPRSSPTAELISIFCKDLALLL